MMIGPSGLRATLALLLLAAGSRAVAHTSSTGLANVSVDGATVTYRLTLVLPELPEEPRRLLAAAADGDAAAAEQAVEELRRRVVVRADDEICRPGRATVRGSRLGDGRVDLEMAFRCPAVPSRLVLRDDWAALFGEHHQTLARVEVPGGPHQLAFSASQPEATVELARGSGAHASGFVWLGFEHILSGWDHLLFLAALLLRGGTLRSILKIITAFTLAHSVTLAAAVLGLASLSPRFVEPVIAASIVWVAIENVRQDRPPPRRWLAGFAFGLVHGFGFATALQELSLPPWPLARALVQFNLGVEGGQALVVVMVLPLLVWLQRTRWEPRVVRASSMGLAVVGSIWFVQRVFFA
jgi:hydrogenase/urease accessory protein HupE